MSWSSAGKYSLSQKPPRTLFLSIPVASVGSHGHPQMQGILGKWIFSKGSRTTKVELQPQRKREFIHKQNVHGSGGQEITAKVHHLT